nr:glycoside hydrolase family 5 protein [Lachnospiraceae bacterium]
GQYGKAVGKTGIDIFKADPDRNTMFSVHMYGFSGGSERSIRNNLNAGLERNLCVCVGEFGYTHSDGDVKEDYLMRYCTEQDIGYLAWSWKGNSGGVEYLDLTAEWDGSVLSADWGENAVNGEYGIRATSKKISY